MPSTLWAQTSETGIIDEAAVEAAERIAGLKFTPEQRKTIVATLRSTFAASVRGLHALDLPNHVPPAIMFWPGNPPPADRRRSSWPRRRVSLPTNEVDLAFLPVLDLAALVRSKQVSARELTELALKRIERLDPKLLAVTEVTAARARAQAKVLDEEASRGKFRSMLHGIPWGAKDLLAVEGTRTTWGSAAHKDQRIEQTATVVQRLDDAGAVLVAKLTLGELAMGDIWYGGRTNNPWNPKLGSSGSSAGPASAVAAGLLPFAIGSETLGSISSPSTRYGVTGLRPTFGRVPRTGAMALSWTMDKLGPMARSAEDLALVLEVVAGADGEDPTVQAAGPWRWSERTSKLENLKVGYLKSAFDSITGSVRKEANARALEALRTAGAQLIEIELPDHRFVEIELILLAEAAAAFDSLTRSGRDQELVQQAPNSWPNLFRSARFVSAVDYINANRSRTLLMQKWEAMMSNLDALVCPTDNEQLLASNLTGHPAVILPHGLMPTSSTDSTPTPMSITVLGKLWGEGAALRVAQVIEAGIGFYRQRPPMAQ